MKPKHQLTIKGRVILAESTGVFPAASARGRLETAKATIPGTPRNIHCFRWWEDGKRGSLRTAYLFETNDGRFYDIDGAPAGVITPAPRP